MSTITDRVQVTTMTYGRERLVLGDHALVIVPRDRKDQHFWKRTRVFGAIDTLGDAPSAQLDANTERPVSGPGLDDFATDADRATHLREYRTLKRQVTAHVRARLIPILEAFANAPTALENIITEMNFSINAGCSCPCSPGFILRGVITCEGQPVDLWLEPAVQPEVIIDHSDY